MAIVDPLLVEYFWPVTAGAILSIFGALPGIILILQIFLAIVAPLVYIGLAPINVTLTGSTVGYFATLYLLIGDTVTAMMAAPPAGS